jgi:hypothetical protein
MKHDESREPDLRDKDARDKFKDVGVKIMSISKVEIDARDKLWHKRRAKKSSRSR